MGNKEILMSTTEPPAAARPLLGELDRYSTRKNGTE
jgi:hypothetical protein